MGNVIKKTATVGLLTLVSRVLGLVRDMVVARIFGTSLLSDAFFMAFRPFDLLRKLFSDGIMTISFVPIFSRYLEKGQAGQAWEMVFSTLIMLSAGAALLVPAGMFLAPLVMEILAPGFEVGSHQFLVGAAMLKIMMPYLWLIMMVSLCMGVLNSFGNFHAPAAAPVVFNLVVIFCTLFLADWFTDNILVLALGVTLGGCVQLFLQVPFMIPCMEFRPLAVALIRSFHKIMPVHPGLVLVAKRMVPSMIGAATYQINVLVAALFASGLSEGRVSFLYYADRLVQFPLALLAVSVSSVLLPDLSRKAASGKWNDISQVFERGIRLVLFISFPAVAGLMAIREPMVRFLFNQGAFGPDAARHTADCLFFLAPGLWAYTGNRLFATLHYSLSSVRLPFYGGVLSLLVNLILCFLVVGPMGLTGLALSVSLSAMTGFAFIFTRPLGGINFSRIRIFVSACRGVVVSVIMFYFVRWGAQYLLQIQGLDRFFLGSGILGCILVGMGIVFFAALLISPAEIKMAKHLIKNKTR